MTDLVALAMNYVPTARREDAAEVSYLTAAGWKTTEIAKRLGISWREVNTLRDEAGDGVIEYLRDEGYTDVELIRTLGIPTARLAAA
jgi:Mn-dependent DtxR family transcriptional regulator